MTDKKYRKKVKYLLAKVDITGIFKVLTEIGYHRKVFLDETNAYLSTGVSVLESYGADLSHLKDTIKELKRLFRRARRDNKKS